ncbi:hypothetical protein GGI04_001657 [Coemansia thaxteri]|uniref:AB hydrolase-1 domain-containing protein n=1 Tax=Coemansia thaxteri TaxID=2663907 RepID=A0A9W8EJ30_9FUNG|nr:hypothetical protein H4R26_002898 [Coemansia thaxteri]KAJ2007050.1 hypothetical protein GGI04_001657 [Coemansia thaxteri]KAJ2487981.1 hypothetical protein EV174_000218 [Coemansia sp. RSA 2320]
MAQRPSNTDLHELDRTDIESYAIPGGVVFERFFECPLDYSQAPGGRQVRVFVRHIVPLGKESQVHELPFLLYLQGGPGFECRFPGSVTSGWYSTAISEGYQLLLVDQRGTGLSSPIHADSLEAQFAAAKDKVQYVSCFRADNIVRDCEHIRAILCRGRLPEKDSKLALLGQSFGGFCITTYLSLFPDSISKAFITGGIPPLVDGPDAVYRATYERMIARNKQYYEKFPRDAARVLAIMEHLSSADVLLSDGGHLSPRRFQQLGINFGFTGGFDTVHQLVLQAASDLDVLGKLSARTLAAIASTQSFDSNPLYCILHEAIYCQNGTPSLWSAHRVRESCFAAEFEHSWDKISARADSSLPVYFTGETVYPWMLEDYAELRRLKDVAQGLAEYTGWGQLYDSAVLARNTVPVAGVSYYNDMFVDFNLSEKTAKAVKGLRQWVTNEFHHNGLRADTRVMTYLVSLLRGDITDL